MIIDAHTHFAGDVPEAVALLEELDVRMMNVSYSGFPAWREQADGYRDLAREHPGRYAWCTTFAPPLPDEAGYADRVVRELERDFADGATACKVWRNVGLEARDAAGRYLLVDDPVFEPVFAHLEATGRTVLMHIGEPRSAFQPLEGNPYADFYRSHPEYHRWGHPGLPSYEALIESRDRVVARHPRLRFVGAHLGSLEYDLGALAERLDRFPNLAVDTSARHHRLGRFPREEVRRFLERYPGRIIFGTDAETDRPVSTLAADERGRACAEVRRTIREALDLLRSDGPVTVAGYQVQGLGLPGGLLDRICRANALAWYPALAS